MTHGSLFSGIGGFDLAAEWMGWQNVFHCEWNEFGQKVLKHYWPKSISYADICATDFTIHRGNIDIVTGGFPCQPYSTAGKRLGKEDDRHLWPEMLRAIREIQPGWVVGENVFGLVNWSGGLVFHEVQTDLEAQGYEVQPIVLAAAGVNAPHRRDRVWFVAHVIGSSEGANKFPRLRFPDAEVSRQRTQTIHDAIRSNGFEGIAADPNRDGFNQCNGKHEKQSSEGGQYALGNFNESNDNGNAADTDGIGQRGQSDRTGDTKFFGQNDKANNWETFPTQSPICVRDDGIPDKLDGITFPKWRNESIKAAGNAIVPQVVYQIFKAIEQYEQLNTTT